MNQSIQIPFQHNSTRQNTWRVVWLLVLCGSLLILAFLLHRAWILRHPTHHLRPMNTELSLRIIKQPKQIELLNQNLGAKTMFFGHPWAFSDFSNLAKNEFSLHLNKNFSVIGISIDQQLDQKNIKIFEESGFTIKVMDNATLITTQKNSEYLTFTKQTFTLLWPIFDGLLVVNQAENSPLLLPLQISAEGFRIQAKDDNKYTAFNVFISKNADIIAAFHISENSIFPPLLANISKEAETNLYNLIKQHGAYMVLARDNNGLASYLTVPSANISLDDLAQIGREMINRQSLSTTEWTLKDGTKLQEIRIAPDIQSTISTESDISFISLKNTNGKTVRITKTSSYFSIANRDIELTPTTMESVVSSTTCGNRGVHSFLEPQKLTSAIRSSAENTPGINNVFSILGFQSISVSQNYIFFCW